MSETIPSRLIIEQTRTPEGVHLFAMIGEASVYEASVLEPAVKQVCQDMPERLVVDLAGLVFASSLAVGQIMAVLSTAKRNGARAVVVCEPDCVLRGVLDRARADSLAPMFATRDEAVAGVCE